MQSPSGVDYDVPLTADPARAPNANELVKLPFSAATGQGSTDAGDRVKVYEVFPAPGTIRAVGGLDWNWIQSSSNPMQKLPIIHKGTLTRKWRKMSQQEKADFIEVYRQCGWEITVNDNSVGVGVNYRKIEKPD